MNLSIINPGGTSNFGERAILLGTLYSLRQRYPEGHITVHGYQDIAAEDPPLWQTMQDLKVHTLPQLIPAGTKLQKLARVAGLLLAPKRTLGPTSHDNLRTSDRIFAKGQESLTGSYGLIHLVDSVLEPLLAARINPRVVLYGHSIGPVEPGIQTLFTKWALRRINHILVRDTLSRNTLLALGYPEARTTLIKDLAYTAVANLPVLQEPLPRDHVLVVPNAAIVKSPTDLAAYLDTLEKVITRLQAQGNHVVLASSVTASDWNNDYQICHQLAARVPGTEVQTFQTLNQLLLSIKSATLVVSSRLHPLILATGIGTPVLALSNAPKVLGLLQDLDLEPAPIIANPFKPDEAAATL